ncbi:MAG: hypothetical protein HWE30_17350 [Methylocystaceae bacterium]|nr:hypothetical protein [Methylocystaceae bacterium]
MIARLLLALFTSFSLFTTAHALEVTAQGATQRQALNAALRQAVEMQLGSDVEANSLVENFQVVRQQILKHTRGFVKSYQILKEARLKDGLYEVTIDAVVDETNLKDSQNALTTLMKMAAHPRLLVVGIDEDFDAVSVLKDDFRRLSESVEHILRDDFKFELLDPETSRHASTNSYRYSDRKNNIKRARHLKADYIIFVELIKTGHTPYHLRLESLDVASMRTLAKEEIQFARTGENIFEDAQSHLYGPTAQLASALIDTLKQEVYEDGQRFELAFYKFDDETRHFLETDLKNLPGYVRHKMTGQEKNALNLSYWSMLKAGPLHDEISRLLQAQDIPFDFKLRQRSLSYRFDDPMFE